MSALDPEPRARRLRVLRVDRFAAVQDRVPAPLLGTARDQALPAGGNVLTYGDGGSGKTTLTIDLVAHAAAGIEWLGIAIPAPVTVLLIENEGPRAMFRDKLDRKLDTWRGPDWHERVHVLEEP